MAWTLLQFESASWFEKAQNASESPECHIGRMIFFDWFNATEFFKQTIVLFFWHQWGVVRSATTLPLLYVNFTCVVVTWITLCIQKLLGGRQCLESLAKRVSSRGGRGTKKARRETKGKKGERIDREGKTQRRSISTPTCTCTNHAEWCTCTWLAHSECSQRYNSYRKLRKFCCTYF